MAEFAMACPTCGRSLDDHGVCATCGATRDRARLDGVTTSRTSAHIETPEGGALLKGSPDSLGVFQADDQPANHFLRITTIGFTAVTIIVVGILFVVALGGIVAGLALLGTGPIGAAVGLLVAGGAGLFVVIVLVGVSILANEKKKTESQPSQ